MLEADVPTVRLCCLTCYHDCQSEWGSDPIYTCDGGHPYSYDDDGAALIACHGLIMLDLSAALVAVIDRCLRNRCVANAHTDRPVRNGRRGWRVWEWGLTSLFRRSSDNTGLASIVQNSMAGIWSRANSKAAPGLIQ